jgi:hypothetical protein
MEQEKGFSYQVYKGQQSIPESTMSAGAKIDHRTPRERCFAAE